MKKPASHKLHKSNLLNYGKTTAFDGRIKLLEGKLEHLKLQRDKMLKMEKSDYLASIKKFKQKIKIESVSY